jgi:hypothetical protein
VKISTLSLRFAELVLQLQKIEDTKRRVPGIGIDLIDRVDNDLFLGWRVKAKQLLTLTCGLESHHLVQFVKSEKHVGMESNLSQLTRLRAVFLAAQEDYEGGYLTSITNLVQADLFDSQLDQARELLTTGYRGPSAIIVGIVLETTLRKLCEAQSMPIGKLSRMNEDLARAGVYSKLTQKKVTVWADVRNSAAHGDNDQYVNADVESMISGVQEFLSERLG